jgi:hypothetical protein
VSLVVSLVGMQSLVMISIPVNVLMLRLERVNCNGIDLDSTKELPSSTGARLLILLQPAVEKAVGVHTSRLYI